MTSHSERHDVFMHRRGCHRRGPPGLAAGLIVVTFGVLLLLRELAMLPSGVRVIDFWPLLLVGFGLSQLRWTRGVVGAVLGLAIAFLGAGLLLENLRLIEFGVGRFWPLVIVILGIGMLWRGLTHRGRHHRAEEELSADELHRSVTMGGARIKIDSQQFKGGDISAVMAGVEIDLRQASIAGEAATIDVYNVMAGIEFRVPPSWRVVSEVTPLMGAIEDQTLPPPDATEPHKRLVLTGSIMMGAVNVKN